MKKTIFAFAAVCAFALQANAGLPQSRDGLDLKIALEQQFHSKLESAFPGERFLVTVNLNEATSVKLDLIADTAMVSDQQKSLLDQLSEVNVYSESTHDVAKIASIMDLPQTKVKMKQLEPYHKKADAETDPKVQASAPPAAPVPVQTSPWPTVAVAVMVAFGAAFLWFGTAKIVSAIQATAASTANASNEKFAAAETEVVAPKNMNTSNFTKSWTPVQLKAIFADCYWAGEDSVASALVNEFPSASYEDLRFGKDYLLYLRTVQPSSLAIVQEAYFYNPDPVFFEMSVQDTPAYFTRQCSQLRFNAMSLTAAEMIRAQSASAPKMHAAVSSEMRALPNTFRVKFKDVAEEESILTSHDFSEETKLALPSLYLLQQLDATAFDQVISQVGANELAQAWVGPESVLQNIEGRLPARKREVLSKMKSSTGASRESMAFHKIVKLCQAEVVQNHEAKRAA